MPPGDFYKHDRSGQVQHQRRHKAPLPRGREGHPRHARAIRNANGLAGIAASGRPFRPDVRSGDRQTAQSDAYAF